MASFVIQPPDAFNFSSPNEWPKWKKRFERFRTSSGLCVKPELHQVDALLYIMGTRGEHTASEGGVYDVSNKRRLGLTEYDAVRTMQDGILELIKLEKAA
ncbi:hypothetical protein MTO96_007282 [Rhipicephalus appendiculatus]